MLPAPWIRSVTSRIERRNLPGHIYLCHLGQLGWRGGAEQTRPAHHRGMSTIVSPPVSASAAGAREAARQGSGRFGTQLLGEAEVELGGKVSALDVYGKSIEVTPGVIDEQAEYLFTQGQCLALAVATARRTGCGLVVRWDYSEDDGDEWVGHVWAADDPTAAAASGSQLRDVMGLDTIDAYESRYCMESEYEYLTIAAADVEIALPDLEAAMDHPQDYAVADTFVDAVLARGEIRDEDR